MTPIQIGIQAPDFELPNQHAKPVSLSSFTGRPVVIWFFSRATATSLSQFDPGKTITDDFIIQY